MQRVHRALILPRFKPRSVRAEPDCRCNSVRVRECRSKSVQSEPKFTDPAEMVASHACYSGGKIAANFGDVRKAGLDPSQIGFSLVELRLRNLLLTVTNLNDPCEARGRCCHAPNPSINSARDAA
jgi:hypothetical protein